MQAHMEVFFNVHQDWITRKEKVTACDSQDMLC